MRSHYLNFLVLCWHKCANKYKSLFRDTQTLPSEGGKETGHKEPVAVRVA